jgi:hypothetical protein
MIRGCRSIGLILIAAFATSAVVASAASAQQGHLTAEGPVTLVGTPTISPDVSDFTFFGSKNSECPMYTYTGHKYNVTPHELIPSGASTITLSVSYGQFCNVGGVPMTADMNGCDFALDIEGTTGSADTWAVRTTVACPAGAHIQTTLFSSGAHSFRVCTITIEENAAGYTGLEITDKTNGKVDLTGTASGIKVSRSGLGCSAKTEENAKVDVDMAVVGKSFAGKETAIVLSE